MVLLQPEVRLTVFAFTAPLVECAFSKPGAGGSLGGPFDLSGGTLEFYRKSRVEDPDEEPLYTSTAGDIVITDGPGGLATIQFAAADFRWPAQHRYHVDFIRNGHRIVLAWGPISVVAR